MGVLGRAAESGVATKCQTAVIVVCMNLILPSPTRSMATHLSIKPLQKQSTCQIIMGDNADLTQLEHGWPRTPRRWKALLFVWNQQLWFCFQELKHAEIAVRTKDTPPGLQYENTAPTE